MDNEREQRVAGLMLFMLGGLAGAALALRWSHRDDRESMGSTLQGLHLVLDDTVDTVEATVQSLRRLAAPVHGLLEEASALAGGVERTLDSYRNLGRDADNSESRYVPSMAPDPTSGGMGTTGGAH